MLPPRLHLTLLLAICCVTVANSPLRPAMAQPPIQVIPRRVLRGLDVASDNVEQPTSAGERTCPTPQMLKALGEQSQQPGRNAGATEDQIRAWVRDLDADIFAVRKSATVELTAVGERMVPALLEEMVSRNSLEQRTRGYDILKRLAIFENITSQSAAYEALQKLAGSSDRALTSRADAVLELIDGVYQTRALQRLQARGAIVGKYGFGRAQRIQFMPNGGIRPGEIIGPGSSAVFDENWKGDTADLEMLRFVRDLRHVELKGESINDDFPAALANCQALGALKIHKASITDEGIAKLAGLIELRALDIRYTKITEKSLATLNAMKLTELKLNGTRIPRTAADELTANLPGAFIDIRNGGFLGVGPRIDGRGMPVKGCVVNRPQPDSAGEKAGLIQDDRIIKYDGKDVDSFNELRELIGGNEVDDEITLTIMRNGEEMEKKVVLGEYPENLG